MNAKQKNILYISIGIIILTLITWQLYGGEIFTKTQVLVETNDELFGKTKIWKDKFIWGLDLTGIISGLTILVSAVLIFINRDKKKF